MKIPHKKILIFSVKNYIFAHTFAIVKKRCPNREETVVEYVARHEQNMSLGFPTKSTEDG